MKPVRERKLVTPLNQRYVNWVGPDDEETCEGCRKAFEGNPYPIDEAPKPGSFECGKKCRHVLQIIPNACKNCGNILKANTIKCPKCGATVVESGTGCLGAGCLIFIVGFIIIFLIIYNLLF